MGGKKVSGPAKQPETGDIIRCVLADRTRMDCELLSASLQRISNRCNVVGTASSASEAQWLLNRHRPALVIVSPHLSEGPFAGFDLVQQSREAQPHLRAIMLLDSMEPRMVIQAFQAGAQGVFSRDGSVEALAKCIRVVHQGQIWAGTSELQIILQAMAKRSRFEAPGTSAGIKLLTSREAEVAALVAEGLRNKEISERMKLSAHTVKNYLYRVYEKLGISSRVELANRVLEEARSRESTAADRLAG